MAGEGERFALLQHLAGETAAREEEQIDVLTVKSEDRPTIGPTGGALERRCHPGAHRIIVGSQNP